VIESRRGYHFGSENLTIVRALEGRSAHTLIELGAGSGSLSILAGYTLGARRVIAIETQRACCDRLNRTFSAYRGLDPNGPLFEVLEGDLRDEEVISKGVALADQERRERDPAETNEDKAHADRGVDGVILNPPFFPAGWGRESGSLETHHSTHALAGDIVDFLLSAQSLISSRGWILILYDAQRMADLLPALVASGLNLEEVRYTPDCRSKGAERPHRVWCFCSRLQRGAEIQRLI
jgi:tRNA1(Val) A37 N6-methylase TrmN6